MCWYGRRNKISADQHPACTVPGAIRYLHRKCAVPVVPGWSGTGCFPQCSGRSCCTVCRRIADGWIYGIPDRIALHWRCIRRRFFHDEPWYRSSVPLHLPDGAGWLPAKSIRKTPSEIPYTVYCDFNSRYHFFPADPDQLHRIRCSDQYLLPVLVLYHRIHFLLGTAQKRT